MLAGPAVASASRSPEAEAKRARQRVPPPSIPRKSAPDATSTGPAGRNSEAYCAEIVWNLGRRNTLRHSA
jgi:hypothetical protein